MAEATILEIYRSNKNWLIAINCLLVGGFLFGISNNLAKYSDSIGLNPLAFIFWSVLGAAIILLAISFLRRELPALNKRSIEYYLIAALVGVAAPYLIIFTAIPQVGAGFVILLITLSPLLTYFGALLLKMECFNALRAMGVATALGGATVLSIYKLTATSASISWIALVFFVPVLLAIGNLYRTLRWPGRASPSSLAPGMLIAAAIQLILFSTLPGFSLTVNTSDGLQVGIIILQALFFAGQFQVFFLLQKTGGPVLFSLLGSIGAMFGVPVAIFLQKEAPPEGLLLGASLIALGVFLVTWGGMRMQATKLKS